MFPVCILSRLISRIFLSLSKIAFKNWRQSEVLSISFTSWKINQLFNQQTLKKCKQSLKNTTQKHRKRTLNRKKLFSQSFASKAKGNEASDGCSRVKHSAMLTELIFIVNWTDRLSLHLKMISLSFLSSHLITSFRKIKIMQSNFQLIQNIRQTTKILSSPIKSFYQKHFRIA